MLPRIATTLLLIGLATLAGCASPAATPQWDARFGLATRAAFAAQVLHPEAARDNRPVDGLDGRSAPASPFTIGVSGAK
jgi:hypothetical protein